MKAKKTTAGKTATREGKKTAAETPRVRRWRKHAETRIAELRERKLPGLALLDACAEIEGLSPAELIVATLKRERGNGETVEDYTTPRDADTAARLYRAWTDTLDEREPTRARNAGEREVVYCAIVGYTDLAGLDPAPFIAHARMFARRFYHVGDCGIRRAAGRLVSASLFALDALRRCEADAAEKA